MRLPRLLLSVAAALALGVGCSSRMEVPPAPPPLSSGASLEGPRELLRGKASYYGAEFHKRKTASGEIYDQHGLSAAHRTLPFGTRLRVKNPDNGKVVEVKVNDRGPFIKGRILDLSLAAARALGITQSGVASVEAEVLR